MSPYWQARHVYETEPCRRTFDEDLHLHLAHGFVCNRPDFFVMGRPVDSGADPADIVNPTIVFRSDTCDCWHVYLAAGNIAPMWQFLPFPLSLVSFERKNVLRFHRLPAIRRLTSTLVCLPNSASLHGLRTVPFVTA